MPRRAFTDLDALDSLLRQREGVVTHAELRQLGVPPSTITYRIRPKGPWQRILPGVVITHRGTPTQRERVLAALRYAGEGAVLSGAAALRAHGVGRTGRGDQLLVLVPHQSQRSSHDFVVVRRTRRMPTSVLLRQTATAPVARSLIDECRERSTLDGVRELVATVIQAGHCGLRDVAREVYAAARQRTALSRRVMEEMSAGIRSVAEARAREEFSRQGVPQPRWNCEIRTIDDDLVAMPDGVWEDVMAALEIDSMAWHLSPAQYLRTQRRQRRLVVAGVPVLPVGPGDILDDPDAFVREVLEFRREAANRVMPTHLRLVEPGLAA